VAQNCLEKSVKRAPKNRKAKGTRFPTPDTSKPGFLDFKDFWARIVSCQEPQRTSLNGKYDPLHKWNKCIQNRFGRLLKSKFEPAFRALPESLF